MSPSVGGPDDGAGRGCPEMFADRYAAAYRIAYRLLGDAVRATSIARDSVAAAGVAVVPRSDRARAVKICRAAGRAALRAVEDDADAPADERARLRVALRALPAQPRDVFLLIRVAELSAVDVGAALGLAPDWCASQLRVADRSVLGTSTDRAPAPAGSVPAPRAAEGPSRGRRDQLLTARGRA